MKNIFKSFYVVIYFDTRAETLCLESRHAKKMNRVIEGFSGASQQEI
jgi:hypothetical protein